MSLSKRIKVPYSIRSKEDARAIASVLNTGKDCFVTSLEIWDSPPPPCDCSCFSSGRRAVLKVNKQLIESIDKRNVSDVNWL